MDHHLVGDYTVLPNGSQAHRIEDNGIGTYLRDIARYTPLTAREECETAARIRLGDQVAFERLIKTNLRFVVSVARNYQHQGMSLCDLINEGNLGLIRAARKFDEKKNFKFISYAVWWIRQAILQALAEHSRILRIPLNRVGTIYRVGKTRARLEQRYQRQPDARDIAVELGIDEQDVARSIAVSAGHASLDSPAAGSESGEPLMAMVRDQTAEVPDEPAGQVSLGESVERMLDELGERERQVVLLYFGIGIDEVNCTLEEIGERLSLTRERVRQIKVTAIQKLRRAAHRGQVEMVV